MQLKDIESLKTMQIRAGSIFKVVFYRKDGVMPKGFGETSRLKYFVIVGVDEEGNFVATSLINTSVNINLAHVIAPIVSIRISMSFWTGNTGILIVIW